MDAPADNPSLPFELVPEEPTGPRRPRRRVFAGGRLRPPGVVRQEKAARVGRALGKALAWAAFVAGVWAAIRHERGP